MNSKSFNLKLFLGIAYIGIILIGLYYLFSIVDIQDLTSYEFIRTNRDTILNYKNENFLYLTFTFFIFSVLWVLLLGFASPLLIFAGFAFGKWWGILIVLTATTLGSTLLYILAGFFFRKIIEEKLSKKFSKLRELFIKNDIIYFMIFRFVGGGGTPYSIQNILPVLFNMPIKNYVIATFVGCLPSMFVTVALGNGIEKVINQNIEMSFLTILYSPEIYLPLIAFFFILIIAIIIKKFYFKP